jgi:hypothetical protein
MAFGNPWNAAQGWVRAGGGWIAAGLAKIMGERQAATAQRRADVRERGHMTEEFSRAAEMLGSEQLVVRLGGIDAMWRLAQESPSREMQAAIDIFCAFVRDPAHGSVRDDTGGHNHPDVRAIMALIGGKDAAYRRQLKLSYFLNLEGAGLAGADLAGARLFGIDLIHADLSGANLVGADLWDAALICADLSGARLHGATLSRANFCDADLSGADLSKALLWDADLTHATLSGADLSCALLMEADLSGANLTGADLRGAAFSGEDPTGDAFEDEDLRYDELRGPARHLTQEQLAAAKPTPPPESLPDNLIWPFVEINGEWVKEE